MIRRVVIVEDETAAAVNLRSMLVAIDESIEIVAVLESVEESVEYFSHAYDADVIFMDIHLADGDSFRIFQSVDIATPIIFTTAYDEYALQAFKVNSIDYLLKPFKDEDLRRALEKLERLTAAERVEERTKLDHMIAEHGEQGIVAGHTEEAEAHDEHTGDGAGIEGDAESLFHALFSGGGSTHVGAHGHVHADEAGGAGEHSAEHEAQSGEEGHEHEKEGGDHGTNDGDGAVLAAQVGLSAFLNGASDALHVSIAGGSGKDGFGRLGSVEQGEAGARKDEDQRDESHTYPRQVSKMWKKPEKPAGRRSCPLLPVIKERL